MNAAQAANAVRVVGRIAILREYGATGTGSSVEATNAAKDGGSGGPGGALRRACAVGLATAGGVGLAPVAPGTFGALVGVGIHVALASRGPAALLLALAVVSVAGTWAAGEAERVLGRHDDGRIVIDEVAGQLLGLLPLALLAEPAAAAAPLPLLAGFVAFRALDIAKPFPVRWAERRLPGGVGVMADDLVAGALAALLVAALASLGAFGAPAG